MLALVASALVAAPSDGLITRRYDVAELVVPVPDFVPTARLGVPRAAGTPAVRTVAAPAPAVAARRLVAVLKATTHPLAWADLGGQATVTFADTTLTVTAPPAVQADVARTLAACRAVAERATPTVVVELREVELAVPDDAGRPSADPARPVTLSAAEAARRLDELAADRRTRVMRMPKVTLFDRQRACVQVGHQMTSTPAGPEVVELGTRYTLRPLVAADRSAVALAVERESAVVGAMTATGPVVVTGYDKLAIDVPDGRTVVIPGPTWDDEVRSEYGPPVLSKVPYVNRLFKNVGVATERRQRVLFVTARVLPAEPADEVAALVAAYRAAVAAGRTAEATAAAVKALALDPGCFAR